VRERHHTSILAMMMKETGLLKIQHMTGPTSLITTSIYGKLESQFENRLLTIHPDVSMNQTKRLLL